MGEDDRVFTSKKCNNCGSYLFQGYLSLVCPTCFRGESAVGGLIMSRQPAVKEWAQWEVNKAKLDKLLNDLKEQGISYRELLVEKDRDSLTIEEGEIGAVLMELMVAVTYPVTEDRIRAEIYQISQLFDISTEHIAYAKIENEEGDPKEGFVTPDMLDSYELTEDEIKMVLRECNLPDHIPKTKRECIKVIDVLSVHAPRTKTQEKVLWHLACLITELPYAEEMNKDVSK